MKKEKIRIVIAEDHVVLRQGLRLLLELDQELLIVGEADNGLQVLDILAATPADIVLMDVNMPLLDGFAATSEVKVNFPDTSVIALSMVSDLPSVQRMLSCGASGYLLKTSGREELCAAIKLVAGGGNYISADLSFQALQSEAGCGTKIQGPKEERELSKREVEVLKLIADGYTNLQIAEKLFTSKRTVETHRQNILEKTHAKNTPHLIKYAIKHKLIDINQHE